MQDEFKEYVLEKTEEVTFSDCESESVLLAARCGIVKGMGDGTFLPKENITREQAATMLYRTYSCGLSRHSVTFSRVTSSTRISTVTVM